MINWIKLAQISQVTLSQFNGFPQISMTLMAFKVPINFFKPHRIENLQLLSMERIKLLSEVTVHNPL